MLNTNKLQSLQFPGTVHAVCTKEEDDSFSVGEDRKWEIKEEILSLSDTSAVNPDQDALLVRGEEGASGSSHGIHEKMFSCKSCPKSFTLHHHLLEHMRTHAGEKPLTCN